MTCKILKDPTLAECWKDVANPNCFLFGGDEELSLVEKFFSLCNLLETGVSVVVIFFGDTWYENVIEQAADYRGYEVIHEGIATEMVTA